VEQIRASKKPSQTSSTYHHKPSSTLEQLVDDRVASVHAFAPSRKVVTQTSSSKVLLHSSVPTVCVLSTS
jgi:hypothetical protein